MRRIPIAVAIAVMAIAGFVAAPQAEAQTYPSVRDVTQFTQSANYMSLTGYLRWRYYLDSGRWVSLEKFSEDIHDQRRNLIHLVPTAPTG